jgi:hypothetical protein
MGFRNSTRDFRTWISGPGFQELSARFQDLALRTWVSGPQREVSGPGFQDLGFRPSTRGFRTWISGLGFQALNARFQDRLGGWKNFKEPPGSRQFEVDIWEPVNCFNQLITHARSQDLGFKTSIFGSQDLGFRNSMRGFRTWISGPGFQDLESSPSYSRLIFFPSLFSASSGHRPFGWVKKLQRTAGFQTVRNLVFLQNTFENHRDIW